MAPKREHLVAEPESELSAPVLGRVGGNPYLITGPALISFSGGRTSAYMLKMILDAHGGTLPDDVHVCFANTGKEREETLRFVHECATRWGVRVRWIQWAPSPGRRKKGEPKLPLHADNARRFEEVGYNSAARLGEPFAAVIRSHQYLPNPAMRYCTTELKVRPMKHFMLAQGHTAWTNAIGLRADEMMRVFKQIERNESSRERWQTVMPLATAKIRSADVLDFWRQQPFDLQLRSHEGNCDLCFLKSRGSKAAIIRDNPSAADWWIAQEKFAKCSAPGEQNARFRADESIEQLRRSVMSQPTLPFTADDEDFDAECGLWCAGEAA